MKLETRVAAELRADAAAEAGGVRFSGYAAKFDRWSEDLGGFVERIAPGAFEGAAEADVRCVVNHNPDRVLGRTKSGTLKLREDGVGLWFEVDAPDAGWTRDLRESVARGDIDQCSFMFEPLEEDWDFGAPGATEPSRRTLKKVRLYDVSIVTYPAYPDTEAYARGAAEAMEKARKECEEARRAFTMERRRLKLKLLTQKSADF